MIRDFMMVLIPIVLLALGAYSIVTIRKDRFIENCKSRGGVAMRQVEIFGNYLVCVDSEILLGDEQ